MYMRAQLAHVDVEISDHSPNFSDTPCTYTSIKFMRFYSLRLKYQVSAVRNIPKFETEILSKMYNSFIVECY